MTVQKKKKGWTSALILMQSFICSCIKILLLDMVHF